jgi:two-component system cell cycle sensor histidine kinase/response regulator CckA
VHAQLRFELAPALVPVRADGPLLAQAIGQLVANAAEAMPEGGDVVVRTQTVDVSRREGIADGRYAVVSIEDFGRGLDDSTLEHVFEPFFTTKDVGEGTGGLGLASAYGTVRQTGGTITVESEVGRGSTFSIYLPEVVPDAPAGGTGETVLIVDRDPAVRDVAFEILTDAAYRVLTARTTVEAVRLAERHAGRIDVLLTDLDQLRESALAALLRETRPDLRTLSLPKPYTPDRLRAAVRDAVRSPERVTGSSISG